MLKSYSALTLLWSLPGVLVIGLLLGLYRTFNGSPLALLDWLRAWAWNVLHLPSTVVGRRRARSARQSGDDELFRTAANMREVAVRVLKEFPKISNPYPNVDAVSGTLLNACGLTDSNYYTVLFGLSRCTGISAQIVDERLRFRGGKGAPIYRPKYVAEDQAPRHVED